MNRDETFDMKYSIIITDIIQNIQFEYEDYPEKYSIKNLNFNKIYNDIFDLIKENSKDYKNSIDKSTAEDSLSDNELDFFN